MASLLWERKKEWPGDPIVYRIKGLGKQVYFCISWLQTVAPPDRLILRPHQLPSRKSGCSSSKQTQAWTPSVQGLDLGAQRNAGARSSFSIHLSPGGRAPPSVSLLQRQIASPPLCSAHQIISSHHRGHSELRSTSWFCPQSRNNMGASTLAILFTRTNDHLFVFLNSAWVGGGDGIGSKGETLMKV